MTLQKHDLATTHRQSTAAMIAVARLLKTANWEMAKPAWETAIARVVIAVGGQDVLSSKIVAASREIKIVAPDLLSARNRPGKVEGELSLLNQTRWLDDDEGRACDGRCKAETRVGLSLAFQSPLGCMDTHSSVVGGNTSSEKMRSPNGMANLSADGTAQSCSEGGSETQSGMD